MDVEAVELAAALELMRHILAQRHNSDGSDLEGSTRRCGCGQQARFNGYRSKAFRTALGSFTLERAYCHCGACGQGRHPRDAALGLDGRAVSPGLEHMIGGVAAQVSFARSSEMLQELTGLHVPTTQVEHVAKALGRDIDTDERQVVASGPAGTSSANLGLDGSGGAKRAATEFGLMLRRGVLYNTLASGRCRPHASSTVSVPSRCPSPFRYWL